MTGQTTKLGFHLGTEVGLPTQLHPHESNPRDQHSHMLTLRGKKGCYLSLYAPGGSREETSSYRGEKKTPHGCLACRQAGPACL